MRDNETNDFKLQGTLDIRIVNTVRRFLEENGAKIRSLSELQRTAFEFLEGIAVRTGTIQCELRDEAIFEMREITYGKSFFQTPKMLRGLQREAESVEEVLGDQTGFSTQRIKVQARRILGEMGHELKDETKKEPAKINALEEYEMAQAQELAEQQLTQEERDYHNALYQLTILKMEDNDQKLALAKSRKEREAFERRRDLINKYAMFATNNKSYFKILTEL